MDDFELEIKREFINEALMNLEEVEGSFMELESSPDPKPLLDKIFRLAHNLKGGSRAVGFGSVAEFTHQLESLVLKIQKSEVALGSEVITVLLRSNDRLVEMLSALKDDFNAQFENSDLLSELQKWLSGTVPQVVTINTIPTQEPIEPVQESPKLTNILQEETTPPPAVEAFGIEQPPEIEPSQVVVARTESAKADPTKNPASKPAEHKHKKEASEDEVIRVSLSKIDLLNDYVGELIVLQSMVQQQSTSEDKINLSSSIRQVIKLCKDIQSLSMGLRMLPVKPLIQKLQRVVRDTAKALNKEVDFEVVGEQLDIDKSVLDQLADPLIHILRNAVDHGLETTEGRTSAGKAKTGKVLLSLSNEGNHLIVEVKDDGKGINSQVLKTKAIEKGLITESQTMSEKQLIHLIFHPGFSTKSETSEISGRGVGMDVVKTNLEKIGGQVDVQTQVGSGSVFRMQIPLSLAVIEGLVVASESQRYVIPISQTQETVNLRNHKLHQQSGIGSCFELRGIVVPLITLQEALTRQPSSVRSDHTVLIVSVEDRLLGLAVTDILRSQQIVIKPLKNGIIPQRGWVGTCVLGDGLPTLILNPTELLQGRIATSQNTEPLGRSA